MNFIAYACMYSIAYQGTLEELNEQIEDSGYDFEDFDFYLVTNPVAVEQVKKVTLVLA